MDRRTLLTTGLRAGAGLAATALSTHLAWTQPGTSKDITGIHSLKSHAAARGLLAGCAVDMHALQSDAIYRQTIVDQYSILVGENCMKFQAMQPKPDTYNFTEADTLLAFAQAHGMKLRGHNFVWHEALPAWFADTATKENARRILTDHISTIASRYKGKIHSWDVVNEAISIKDGRPDGLRSSSPWFQLLGPEYLEIAFRTARQADPTALLTYNDYDIEYDDPDQAAKRAAVLGLLRRLKAANVPLDALGVQSHLHAGGTTGFTKGLPELMAGAHELGLQVFATEMDVKDDGVSADEMPARDQAVAAVYARYLQGVLRSSDVKAVLTWGVSDGHTWLNQGTKFRGQHSSRDQRPLPFDPEYQPAPAFFAMRDAFDRAPPR